MLFISLATLCFHVPICWVLVFKSGMENTGAALALGLSYWFNVILLGFYMKYLSSCEKTHVLILKDIFLSVKEFFHFGIPSAVMVCLEWWSFEILVLLSELLPNSKLETSVLSIWYYYTHPYKHVLHFNIPVGITAAASTRVSNELGAGNPQAAQIAALVVMVLTLAESFIASTILFCCRHAFGYAYSNDKEVVNNVTKMIPLMCLSIVMDSLHAVLGGFMWFCFAFKRGRSMGWNVDRVNHTRNSSFFGGCFYNLEKTSPQSRQGKEYIREHLQLRVQPSEEAMK
ncbi:Multi antimicrobial extrusion protein - like 10 [Theobroma cacao]|nr:Multi antimicrobial extrusion protein - like 10 [Theobroma cacao]